jgi:hypothetical protein
VVQLDERVLNCGENAAVVFTIATAVSSDRTVLVNMFEPSELSNSAVEDPVWQKTNKKTQKRKSWKTFEKRQVVVVAKSR